MQKQKHKQHETWQDVRPLSASPFPRVCDYNGKRPGAVGVSGIKWGPSMGVGVRRRQLLLTTTMLVGALTSYGRQGLLAFAVMASCALWTAPALSQNATWLPPPATPTGDFNTNANWNPAVVPTGTAFFGLSDTTALSFSANTTIGGLTGNAAVC